MSHHPTILIGYGDYGLRVLQSFLASAAARGALLWEKQVNVGDLNERRLHSLSLLYVPDQFSSFGQDPSGGPLGHGGYELMDDLYSQVRQVSEHELVEAVEREKKRLLSFGQRNEANVAGLDVMLIAQPSREEIVGALRDLIEPVMKSLATDPIFATVQGGAGDTLNFLEVLDFDDYWSPRMGRVRQALQWALQQLDEGFAAGSPTVGRVYLFDGSTQSGKRTAESRLQEVVLFLELMLLEGLRNSPDTQALFRRQRVSVPAVCTVGVRVVERSSGLLRRLAAAAFARGWLAYISSSSKGKDVAPHFAELVKPFRAPALAGTIGEPELLAGSARQLTRVMEAMLKISPHEDDWGERLRVEAERQTDDAILQLSKQSGTQSAALTHGILKDYRDNLERSVTSAMQAGTQVSTLGAVIDELGHLQDEFEKAVLEAEPGPDAEPDASQIFEEAGRMQREYHLYLSRQLQTAQFKTRWWPRAAVMFAVAFSPMVLEGIADAWYDNPIPLWLQLMVTAFILGGAFFWFGRKGIQRHIEQAAERGREAYAEAERGRLAERVRRAADSPLVRGRIENHARLLAFGLKQYVLGVVASELERARSTLVRRREEVEWLQRQVGEFLVSYQVDASRDLPVFQAGRFTGDVRYSLETNADLTAVAQSVPRGVDRFREMTAYNDLFATWSQPYCETFLHPVPFLDQLSERFQDRLELDEEESRRRAGKISSFLTDQAHVSVCFHWLAAGGLPTRSRDSLFPRGWNAFPGVRHALAMAAFGEHVVETPNGERMYLFESVLGIPYDLLVRTQ